MTDPRFVVAGEVNGIGPASVGGIDGVVADGEIDPNLVAYVRAAFQSPGHVGAI